MNISGKMKTGFWVLMVISLLLNGLIWSGKLLSQTKSPLFGFQICALDMDGAVCRRIAWPNLRNHGLPHEMAKSRRLQFQSELYLAEANTVLWHLSGSGSTSLKVNGMLLRPMPENIFLPVGLRKGLNHISIQWNRPPDADDLYFVFKGSLYDTDLPFYHWLIPESNISSLLGRLLILIQPWRNAGYYSALLVLLILIISFVWQNRREPDVSANELSTRLSWASLIILSYAIILILIYFNQFLGLGLPNLGVVLVGLLLPLLWFGSKRILPNTLFSSLISWETVAWILSASLIILISSKVYYQTWIPYLRYENSDLSAHMEMIDSLYSADIFSKASNYYIYPQGIHCSVAVLARALSIPVKTVLQLSLILFFLAFLILQFKISRLLFPGVGWFWIPLASVILVPGFLFQSMFGQFSFPAIVATTLFLWSLVEGIRGRFFVGMIVMISAATIYPLFLPPFLLIYLSAVQRMRYFSCSNWWKTLLAGTLSAITMVPYGLKYLADTAVQHQDGFQFLNQIDLFTVLGSLVTFITLLGIYRAFCAKEPAMFLGLSAFLGFGMFYVPHILFSFLSQYYILKNLVFLVPLLVPVMIYGLRHIIQRSFMKLLIVLPIQKSKDSTM